MGKRKRISSYIIKNKNKKIYYSLLKRIRISSRKIIKLVNIIKGTNVNYALNILDNYINYKLIIIFKRLILSAIANFNYKNKKEVNNKNLYISNIIVNNSGYIKKLKYVSQGRCHIIRKRFSNIKLIIIKK